MRNEISYNEFMRLSGGRTIEDELVDAGTVFSVDHFSNSVAFRR